MNITKIIKRVKIKMLANLTMFEVGQPVALYWGEGEFYAGKISDVSTNSITVKMNFGDEETLEKSDFSSLVPLVKFLKNKTPYTKKDLAKYVVKTGRKGKNTVVPNGETLSTFKSVKGELKIIKSDKGGYAVVTPESVETFRTEINARDYLIKNWFVPEVDAQYNFKYSTPYFKEYVFPSLYKKEESVFLTAKKFDEGAKKAGLIILWDETGDPNSSTEGAYYLGAIKQGREKIGLIVINDDGSSYILIPYLDDWDYLLENEDDDYSKNLELTSKTSDKDFYAALIRVKEKTDSSAVLYNDDKTIDMFD